MTKRLILFTEKYRCLLCKSRPHGQSAESVILKQMTRGDELQVKEAVLEDPVLVGTIHLGQAIKNDTNSKPNFKNIHLLTEIWIRL